MKLVALSLDGGFAGGGGGGTPGSSKSKFRKSFTMAAVFDFRRSCFRPVPPLRDELFGVQLLVHGAGLRSDFASGLFCFQSFLDFIFFNNWSILPYIAFSVSDTTERDAESMCFAG
jgi:hypothetical protein